MDGMINIYKERGYTSHDVVARLRGILQQKRIGHTGTLDPDAQGVLPVCLGKGTKLCGMLTDATKTYRAVLQLGVATDTEDMTGTVLERRAVSVTEEQVETALQDFEGELLQVPPMYSARKINGRKLYELAREGRTVEREPRRVTIHRITVEQIALPYVTMQVECSKGTYIRSLCRDIGEQLGCLGAMAELTRLRVGSFSIAEALRLERVEQLARSGELGAYIVPVDAMFTELPEIIVTPEQNRAVDNGNAIRLPDVSEQTQRVRIYKEDKTFIGLYQRESQSGVFKPFQLFFVAGK